MAAEAAAASSFSPWGLAALGLGLYSSFASTRAAQKVAEAAAEDAKDQRMRVERRAADTKQALGTEIDTMRQLRSLSSPAYQQAAQISFLQAKKGSERMARNRAMGRLAPEVRDAIFGGQFQQYVGREGQKIQRYAQMTESIYGMAQQQQSAVEVFRRADAPAQEGVGELLAGVAGEKILVHFGFDVARRDGVDANVVSRPLEGQRSCHHRDRHFRH